MLPRARTTKAAAERTAMTKAAGRCGGGGTCVAFGPRPFPFGRLIRGAVIQTFRCAVKQGSERWRLGRSAGVSPAGTAASRRCGGGYTQLPGVLPDLGRDAPRPTVRT